MIVSNAVAGTNTVPVVVDRDSIIVGLLGLSANACLSPDPTRTFADFTSPVSSGQLETEMFRIPSVGAIIGQLNIPWSAGRTLFAAFSSAGMFAILLDDPPIS